MSRSVDLFVEHGDPPHQLLVMLGNSAHGSPVETSDGRWQLHFGPQLVAQVYRHSFVDDGDLHLSRYPWVVSIRTGHEGSLVDHPATAALRMVADDLRTHRRRVLLVLDLQYRLDLGPEPSPPDPAAADPAAPDPAAADPAAADPASPDPVEASPADVSASLVEASPSEVTPGHIDDGAAGGVADVEAHSGRAAR